MSGTGSLMIRNLKKPSDYSKAVMTQDELLRIAISNDANVAQARKGFQQGMVEEVSKQLQKSPAELQADQALQEKTALDNLLQLFPYREVSQILPLLSSDEIFLLNTTFPQIKNTIQKKFNTKLVSPTFFIEFLKKYIEELNESKGVDSNSTLIKNKFNQLTDNINDVRAILPTQEQFNSLSQYLRFIETLPVSIVEPVLERIERLQDASLSASDFRRVSADQEILQYETLSQLQNITESMPTREEITRIIDDIRAGRVSQQEGFTKIENSISGITNSQLDLLEDIKREIQQGATPSLTTPLDISSQVQIGITGVPSIAVARKITAAGTPGARDDLYIIYTDGRNEVLTLSVLRDLLQRNEEFRNWYARNVTGAANISNLKTYIGRESALGARARVAEAKEGVGIKAKNGKIVAAKKIGKGVSFEAEPNYRQFGKYVINMPQLKERDILNVKFPSLGRIPQYKPIAISDVFKEFILELLDSGKVSQRIYDQIPIDERQLFERIATGAGLAHKLKLKRTITDEDKADNERFAILKGEYLAGNNSVALMKELRKIVVKFMTQGKILKQDGMNLLMELSI